MTLRQCIIADNVARGHAGGTFGGGSHITVTACILVGDTALNSASPSPQSEARCSDGGLNVIWPKGGGEPARTLVAAPVFADPHLGPLGDHGDPVPTRRSAVATLITGAFPPALKAATEKAEKKEKKAKPAKPPGAPVSPSSNPAP